MLFDRLPYLGKIQDTTDVDLRKVKQVTQFHGVNLQDDSETVSDEGAAETAVDLSAADETTDRLAASPKKKDRIMRVVNDRASAQLAAASKMLMSDENNDVKMEKLYISDDDIQDD